MDSFNPLAPQVLSDPYLAYAAYRREEPVHWGLPGDPATPGCWYIFRSDDAMHALKDPRFGREVWRLEGHARASVAADLAPLRQVMDHWMILRDPPVHTRLRGLVSKAFVPRVAEQLAPRIASSADALIDVALARGHMDVIADYARVLPVLAIAQALGVPPEDHAVFLPWAVTLAQTIEFRQTDDVRRIGARAVHEMQHYLRELITVRRLNPRDDLLTGLIQATDDGGALSEEELLGSVTLLLTAGNDPTQHMVGNAVYHLLRRPDAFTWLRAHPEAMELAIDELLRFDSSVQATFRFALEGMDLRGRRLRAGDPVAILFGSALRDPAYCDRPDELDLTRKNNALPFGFGPHFCLGMPLARTLGRVALERLLQRMPGMVIASRPDEIEWEERLAVRGLKALPVTIER